MAQNLTTDFNVSPYFDDYDENKKFSRVLFKPAVAIQARELTQLQTILQAQVQRFGNNIYKEGTIIEGCDVTFDETFSFVKLLDLDTSGTAVAPSTYTGFFAKGVSSGVVAKVSHYVDGLVTQDPNLTTLYVDYTRSNAATGAKVFSDSENIEIHSTFHANDASPIATVTAAGSLANNVVGDGYAVTVGEGIVYAKGHFLKVSTDTVVASKYNKFPDNVAVGFNVKETVITSDADNTLLDNAAGFNNENAPGADRLKLDPFLVAIPFDDARANTDFLSLVDFQSGLPITKRFDTQFNSVDEFIAKRTKEESGNFSVRTNNFQTEAANTTTFNLVMSSGLHYVNGKRAEQFNTTRINLERSTANASMTNVVTTTNQGSYVVVDQFIGTFQANTLPEVSLRDTAGTAVTDGDALSVAPGNEIGKARLRSIERFQDLGQASKVRFKMHLFNVKMNAGKRFKDTRAVSSAGHGCADIVLDTDSNNNSKAVLKEANADGLIYPLPVGAVKETTSSDYIFRTVAGTTVTGSNTITITSPSGAFPYSGSLTNAQKKEWIVVANTTGANLVSGVPLDYSAMTINVSGATATIDISGQTSSAPSSGFTVSFNAKKSAITAPIKKTLKEVYVKLHTSNNAATSAGPFSLGMPDVQSIEEVYENTANTTSWLTTGSNLKDNFTLEENAFGTHYGLSTIALKPGQSLGANSAVTVKVKVFESDGAAGGVGFYSVSSYKKADGTTALDPEDVPVYRDEIRGVTFDLRSMIDCRPQVAATAAFATTIGAATKNPSATETFAAADPFIAAPDRQFQCDLVHYLGRIDKVLLTESGLITTSKGIASLQPVPPSDKPSTMTLGSIHIPPFPSLTSDEAKDTLRKNEAIKIQRKATARYTMADIGKIDRRLKNIEYYTTLSQLETKTSNMAITDANGNDRFKNGIFVDPATNFDSADLNNREFRCSIDSTKTMFVPKQVMTDVDLVVANTNNVIELSGSYTMDGAEQLTIEQVYGTTARPCTDVYYKYFGKLTIFPSYDAGYDETVMPTKEIVNDQASGIQDLFDGINEVYPLTRTSTELIGSDTVSEETSQTHTTTDHNDWGYDWWEGEYDVYHHGYGHHGYGEYYGGYGHHGYGWNGYWWGGTGTTTTETTTTTTTSTTTDTYLATTQSLSMGVKESTEKIGDFITDITFSPFMRAKQISFWATGLKPNQRHYFFFDGDSVNNRIKQGRFKGGGYGQGVIGLAERNVVSTGAFLGSSGYLVSDDVGNLVGQFYLPGGTYHVGEREMVIADVSDVGNLGNSQSKASAKYNAYNYNVEKTEYTLTTKAPTFNLSTSTQEYTNVSAVDVSTNTSTNTDWSWNWNYHNTYYTNVFSNNNLTSNTDYTPNSSYIDYSGIESAAGAGTLTDYSYLYDYTGMTTIYPTGNPTTTGTGDIGVGAITGSGGGANNYQFASTDYTLGGKYSLDNLLGTGPDLSGLF